MEIALMIKGELRRSAIPMSRCPLDGLQRVGHYGVAHGSDSGSYSMCTVLADVSLILPGVIPAAKTDGRSILAIRSVLRAKAPKGPFSHARNRRIDAYRAQKPTQGMTTLARSDIPRRVSLHSCKVAAEIPIDGMAPVVAHAIYEAMRIRIT
ncbi:MAG: hypothetical protein RMK32_06370 [Anaerolineae bacterium]|nr:hypothetical protein [Thermoflexus sp.]MDW8065239.1 hypothetical protein [Anaerolineae bacterium]